MRHEDAARVDGDAAAVPAAAAGRGRVALAGARALVLAGQRRVGVRVRKRGAVRVVRRPPGGPLLLFVKSALQPLHVPRRGGHVLLHAARENWRRGPRIVAGGGVVTVRRPGRGTFGRLGVGQRRGVRVGGHGRTSAQVAQAGAERVVCNDGAGDGARRGGGCVPQHIVNPLSGPPRVARLQLRLLRSRELGELVWVVVDVVAHRGAEDDESLAQRCGAGQRLVGRVRAARRQRHFVQLLVELVLTWELAQLRVALTSDAAGVAAAHFESGFADA
mmetsp:Transcript_3698/g.11696  ORF Transcript_3698/g.11696 Transcript_3698/m.11696 type:complete len:275 (-) Transcript_3698:386-1210(-)